MNQRKFGRTGLSVSELCLGAMQFGWQAPEPAAFAILDAYRAAGGNFVQTPSGGAPAEVFPVLCRAEEIVGKWLRARPGAREQLVLSARVKPPLPPPGGRPGLEEAIRRQCEDSLRRFRTTHLDLLVVEWNAESPDLDGFFGAIQQLVDAGKLRYAGAADFPLWRLMESLGRSSRAGGSRFESYQADYSLLERAPFEPDAIDLARAHRVALIAQSPLAGGFLAAPPRLPTDRSRRLAERYGDARGESIASALDGVADGLGCNRAQAALAWSLSRRGVTSTLVGFASEEQVLEAARAAALALPAEAIARLDAASSSRRVAPASFSRPNITKTNPALS